MSHDIKVSSVCQREDKNCYCVHNFAAGTKVTLLYWHSTRFIRWY